MARPIKQGLDYFPFDVDFFSDEKLYAISGEFGIKGEITTIKLLCAIYRNGYFIEWTDMLKFKLLKELPGISPDLLDQIVKRLVKWGLFDKNLFDSANILTSRGIQRRYLAICTKMHRKNVMLQYNLLDVLPKSDDKPKQPAKPRTEPKKPQPASTPASAPAPFPTPSVEQYSASFHQEVERMSKDTIWIEQGVCMKLHIDKAVIGTLLKQFLAHCISYCSEKPHKSYGDAQQHFIRWYRTEESATAKKQTKSTDPQSPSDYTFSGGFGGEDV